MRYLGVDFGLKRVGLAISEGDLATPWKVITAASFIKLVDAIYLHGAGFNQVVIGLPEGQVGKLVIKAVKILKKKGLNIVTADETLSTQQAQKLMIELNVSKKKRKVTDAHSAAIILQNYLDYQ